MSEQYLNLIVVYREATPALFDLLDEQAEVVRLLTGLKAVVVRPKSGDNRELMLLLSTHPDVERVDLDRKIDVQLAAAPSEPADYVLGNAALLEGCRIPEAWDITKGRSDVVVGISDSGVFPRHPDMNVIESPYYGEDWVTKINDFCYRVDLKLYAALSYPATLGGTSLTFHTPPIVEPLMPEITVYFDEAMTQPVPSPYTPPTNDLIVYTSQMFVYRVTYNGGNTTATSTVICVKEVYDESGHGTAVASVVGAKHNGKKISGIAPECQILPMRSVPIVGSYSMMAAGFDEAVAWTGPNGEKCLIVNCSWMTTSDEPLIKAAVNRAMAAGIIVVFAAGNHSNNDAAYDPYRWGAANFTPTDNMITVSGTGSIITGVHGKAKFAGRYDTIFISAPANDWLLEQPNHATIYYNSTNPLAMSTVTDDTKFACNGTSFATPTVAAVAALMLSDAKNRGQTVTGLDVKNILKASANPYLTTEDGSATYDTTTINAKGVPTGGMGFGLVDACRALRYQRGEIDIRVRTVATSGVVGAGITVHVDAGQYAGGSTVTAVKCYENDVLKATIATGAYAANYTYTPSVSGASVKVHFAAESSAGQTVTSKPLYFNVTAANAPQIDVIGVVHSGSDKRTLAIHSTNFTHHEVPPVLLGTVRTFKARLNSTTGAELTFTKLEVHIDGTLLTTFNNPAFSASYATFTLPAMTEGWHDMRLTLYTASGNTVKNVPVVYSPYSTPKAYAKPWTYQNGIFELEYLVTANAGLNLSVYNLTKCFTRMALFFGEERFAFSEAPIYGSVHRWHRLRLAIPKPSAAPKIDFTGVDTEFDPEEPYYVSEVSMPSVLVSTSPSEAVGNSATVDTRGPITYVLPISSRQPANTSIAVQSRSGAINAASQIFYRYNGGAWTQYNAPFAAQDGTLEWYGVDALGNAEMVNSADYSAPPPPPTIPAVVLQPIVAAPALMGVQIGTISAAPVSLRPSVTVGALSGVVVNTGSISAAAVTLRPSLSPPTLIGLQVGTILAPSVTLRPSVAAPTLTGIEGVPIGSISAPSATVQILVNPPSLVGLTAGTAIRAPSGELWDLRDIYGAPLDIRAVA